MIDDGCYDDKMMRQTTAKSNISPSTFAFVYIDDGGVFFHNNDD